MKKTSLYKNRHFIKTMLPKTNIGGAERSEVEGAAKRIFEEAWQSVNTIKFIYFLLVSLCFYSSPLLANDEAKSNQTDVDTLVEIQQMKENIKILSQNLEAMQKQLAEAEERLKQQEKKSAQPVQPAAYQNQNPDISASVMFRYMGTGDKKDSRRNSLKLDGTEINLTKAVSPYTKGTVTLGFHDDEVHVEEAYADINNNLPMNLDLRVGRMLANTGYLNPLHSHDWPFVCMPFPNQYFYGGEHGYVDDGIILGRNFYINDNTYARAAFNVFNGNNTTMFNDGQTKVIGGKFTYNVFFNDQKDDFQVDFNYNQGAYDDRGDLKSKVYSADAVYRHRINQFDKITLFGEYIKNIREVALGDDLDSYGYYAAAIYKFKRDYNWHIGLEYDYSEKPGDNTQATKAKSIFAGWWLTENDRLQLQFRKIDDPFKGRHNNEVWLQFIWGIGPHKPHLSNF